MVGPQFKVVTLMFVLALEALTPRSATAQCVGEWVRGEAVEGVDSSVLATVNWDQDGAGPLPPLLAVGGWFANAGNIAASGVAT